MGKSKEGSAAISFVPQFGLWAYEIYRENAIDIEAQANMPEDGSRTDIEAVTEAKIAAKRIAIELTHIQISLEHD